MSVSYSNLYFSLGCWKGDMNVGWEVELLLHAICEADQGLSYTTIFWKTVRWNKWSIEMGWIKTLEYDVFKGREADSV